MNIFEEYLVKKKIDPETFRQTNPVLWEEWQGLYEQMHPESFTAQKLFLINKLRRSFPLREGDLSRSEKAAGTPPTDMEETKKD